MVLLARRADGVVVVVLAGAAAIGKAEEKVSLMVGRAVGEPGAMGDTAAEAAVAFRPVRFKNSELLAPPPAANGLAVARRGDEAPEKGDFIPSGVLGDVALGVGSTGAETHT